MISLTNRQTYYDISNLAGTLQLEGCVTLTEDWRVNNFYGQILTTNSLCVGNFTYMEYPNGKSSKNLNDIDTKLIIEISLLINDTIADLKEQIEQFKLESEVDPEKESE